MTSSSDLMAMAANLPATPTMPVLFIGHGSPMNAIEDNEFVRGWKKIAASIPRPAAIICVSAHWETKGTYITAMSKPQTIHDFGGFPQALFDVQYPAPGHPALAKDTKEIITSTEVGLDEKWGLDHGAWSVIKPMYPNADIPVLQLSLDYTKDAASHYQLAKELQKLRNRGVLIIGSGNIVHNLGRLNWANPSGGFDWAIEANNILKKLILDGDYKQLSAYSNLGNAVRMAIPSAEHYLPMLYVLALKNKDEKVEFF